MKSVSREQATSDVNSASASTTRAGGPILSQLLDQRGWFILSNEGVVRCPLLVKGRLIDPPDVDRDSISRAFAALDQCRGCADAYQTYVAAGNAQVLRHREIDRQSMLATGRWIYTVMPSVEAKELVETDIDRLTFELYSLPYDSVLEWLRLVSTAIQRETELVSRVRDIDRTISEHPDAFGDIAYLALAFLFAPENATASVDSELSQHGVPGRRLLDEWVEMPVTRIPGPVHVVSADMLPDAFKKDFSSQKVLVRAMPTRQLHITAGNSPLVPVLSLLRAVWTKSPCALKLPSGAILAGGLVALIAATAAPLHPITQHLSMVYWQGGDENSERTLFSPGAFDRIVVWGSPDSIASVRRRAGFTKVIYFNPRYSVSFIGRDALRDGDLDDVAARAVCDSMIENQKACIASLVHYVEGSVEDAERYAEAVERALARWDAQLSHPLLNSHRALLKRMERGVFLDATVRFHQVAGAYRSGVVIAPHDFGIKDHPMCRLIVVRPVSDLDECLRFLHPGVATVGIFPDDRRQSLRDRVAARGVSNVVPLGHAGAAVAGSSHDGMLVLSELVDWKNG
ncbi:MAG TPA: acyl-CoA reductase [Acidisarcina sp.]